MPFLEKKRSEGKLSLAKARQAGRSALLGEGTHQPKYIPNRDELIRASTYVPNEEMAIKTTREAFIAQTQSGDRALRDVVILGDSTYIGIVDKTRDGKSVGSEIVVLPYGSAGNNRSSVFLRATITPDGRDGLVISRDLLTSKDIHDPQVSNGSGRGHVSIDVLGGVVLYTDMESTNGTRVLRGSDAINSENPEVQRFVSDIRNNPSYLFGTETGQEVVIPQV